VPAAVAAANVAAALAMRGHFEEALRWSARAEEALGESGPRPLRGRLLAARGLIRYALGQDEAGTRDLGAAREALGPGDWPLAFLREMAALYATLDLAAAYDRLTLLLDQARKASDHVRAGVCLMALGWIDGLSGGPAVERFEEARRLLPGRTDPSLLALLDHDLGVAHLRKDQVEEAGRAFARGLEGARASGERSLEYILLNDLGLWHAQRGEDAAAERADREAAQRLAAIGEDLRRGRIEDSLLLDFRQLSKLRYVSTPPMLMDLFLGLFDQLAVEPPPDGEG
jgi:tetratricopeptide (TPR) repeat protein